jgi:hypothetical protein
MATPSKECVILVPSARVFDPDTEAALAELSRRRYPVWRIKGEPAPDIRDRMAIDALAAGFQELFFIDPSIVFEPDDADRLRGRGLPVTCGVYPLPRKRELSCRFFSRLESGAVWPLRRPGRRASVGDWLHPDSPRSLRSDPESVRSFLRATGGIHRHSCIR